MNFDQIIIECSPFLRCIQTASLIAEKLKVKKVEINWLISEHLGNIQFPRSDPIPRLAISKYGIEDFNQNYVHYGIPKSVFIFDRNYKRQSIKGRWVEDLKAS